MQIDDILKQMREAMPPVFAGTSVDTLTGNGIRWRTVQNEKSRGETPDGMFIRQGGRKLLVVRDVFLEYWREKLRVDK